MAEAVSFNPVNPTEDIDEGTNDDGKMNDDVGDVEVNDVTQGSQNNPLNILMVQFPNVDYKTLDVCQIYCNIY